MSVQGLDEQGSGASYRRIKLALGIVALGMFSLFALVSWRARFVMDEFNLLQSLRSFSKGALYQTIDPIKTVLGTEIFRLAMLGGDSVRSMLFSRLLGLAAATGTLVMIYFIAREVWPKARFPMLVLITALSFSNFYERAFRVRTDTIALTFAIGSVLALVVHKNRASRILLAGFLMGMSFLCTQKAVYLMGACILGHLVALATTGKWKQLIPHSSLLTAGILAPLVMYGIYWGGWRWWEVIRMVFLGPGQVLAGTSAFYGLDQFIFQTLERNWILYAIAVIGMGYSAFRWKSAPMPLRFLWVSTLLVTVLVFHHDQPWPYVFVWPQAFLSFWIIPAGEWAVEKRRLSPNQAILALTALTLLSLPRQIKYLQFTNHSQIEVMKEADRLLGPGTTYFDGVGMITDRDIAGAYPGWWWDVPTIARIRSDLSKGHSEELQSILDAKPKIWILNYRILNMSDIVSRMVMNGYVRIEPTILLSGAIIPPGGAEAVFACHWPGNYRLFDAKGRELPDSFNIDGHPSNSEGLIPIGAHTIRTSDSQETRFLLPSGTYSHGPIPPDVPIPDLYEGVYTY